MSDEQEPDRKTSNAALIFVVAVVALVVILPIVAVVLGSAYWFVSSSPPNSNGPQPAQVAGRLDPPSIALPALRLTPLTGEGEPVALTDLKGKVVLVNFWGAWCPPCVEEFPHMVKLAEKFAGHDDFRLLAVSCAPPISDASAKELMTATQAFLDQRDVEMPTFADLNQTTREALRDAIGFRYYPTTVLLDGDHFIRASWVGYQPGYELEMESAVEQLLSP